MTELEGTIPHSFSKSHKLFRVESILEQLQTVEQVNRKVYATQDKNDWRFTRDHHRASKLSDETLEISEQQLAENLSQFSSNLLHSNNRLESKKTTEALKDFLHCYKIVMEEFFYLLDKILQSRLKFLKYIRSTIKKFHILSMATSQVNLASSTLDLGMLVESSLRNVFPLPWNSKMIFYASTFIASLSICGSMFALSYSKRAIDEMSRKIWDGSNFLIDLDLVHRKGNWIDKSVQDLFPHGINLDLIDQSLLEKSRSFDRELSWKQFVCSTIILSNIQKDVKLLMDENFLATVKQFVESEAAQLWWNRMKIRKQIDVMFHDAKTNSSEDLVPCKDVFTSRVAVSVFPLMIPLAVRPRNFEIMRIILSSMAAILSFHELSVKEGEEFEGMKKLAKNIKKEYNGFNKIYMTIDTDYD